MENTQIRLRRRPVHGPTPDDFELVATEVPQPKAGELLVRVLYLSVDPALRPRMNAVSAYAGHVELGRVIPSAAIGVVVESRSAAWAPGDHVFGFFGWQLFAVATADSVRRIDTRRAPLAQWMSLLGLSSFTAYIGLTQFGQHRAGETVVVSAAAGATGSVVGQLARIGGARAVGIAGGVEKCRYVTEVLGFDACVDYRAADFLARLDAACPDGVDVDFENVGGDVLKAVFSRMNSAGRVVLCGLVSEYNKDTWPAGPNLWPAIYKGLRIEGFRASNYFDRIPEFVTQALAWHAEGRLICKDHVYEGIGSAPTAFISMLQGRHLGKVMVRIAGDASGKAV